MKKIFLVVVPALLSIASACSIQDKIYKNDRYGFQINLTDAWNGYKVTEQDDSLGYRVQFSVPTTDPEAKKLIPNFPLLTILVWPKSEWDNYNSDNSRPKPTIKLITEKDGQYFVWLSYQELDAEIKNTVQKDSPKDANGKYIDFEIPKVVSSFKFYK